MRPARALPVLAVLVAFAVLYADAFRTLIRDWTNDDNYSHGFLIIPIALYLIWPPPDTVVGFFELLSDNPVYGLITLDVLYILSNLLAYLLYLALAVVLWRVSRSIERRNERSSGAHSDTEMPEAPARAVRPMRCT